MPQTHVPPVQPPQTHSMQPRQQQQNLDDSLHANYGYNESTKKNTVEAQSPQTTQPGTPSTDRRPAQPQVQQ